MHLDLAVAQALQPEPRRFGQRLMALDGTDLGAHCRQHRRGIAAAGPDLEHAVAGRDLGRGRHQRHDIRLGDGLVFLDRQRHVVIGKFAQVLGDEFLARHAAHRVEHPRIGDAAIGDLPLHHLPPLFGHVFHPRI